MAELTAKQLRIQNEMQPLLKTAPWILRITEQKKYTGPMLEVCERRATEAGKTKLYEYGRIFNGHLRDCKVPIRYMLSQVMDQAGRPLGLQELIDSKIAYRGQLPLDEVTGAKLALLFKLHGQIRSAERLELMAWRIERFGREETMYWLDKVSVESFYGKRGLEWAKSGLRLMLAGQQKDGAEVTRMLEDLRKEDK